MRVDKSFDSQVIKNTSRRERRKSTDALAGGEGSSDISRQGLVRRARPEKNVSESEIRRKLAEKNEVKKSGQSAAQRRALLQKTKIQSNFMDEKAPMSKDEAVAKAEEIRRSDVGVNDPTDMATHGKLRSVIGKGSFGFSEKERAVLEKILAE